MNVREQIDSHIAGQTEPRRSDMRALHALILGLSPDCQLWFLDGKDDNDKTVSNPNIGYGHQIMTYSKGNTREFYRVGFCANSTGVSVYILGLADRTYLPRTYGKIIGKASVTGYCIRFKTLADVEMGALEAAIRDGLAA